MPQRQYSSIARRRALSSGMDAVQTSMATTPVTGTSWPGAPFVVSIDRGTTNEELVLVTAGAGIVGEVQTLTVTRGYDGTTAKTHDVDAPTEHVTSAIDFRDRPHVEGGVLPVGDVEINSTRTNRPAMRFGSRGGLQGLSATPATFLLDNVYNDGVGWKHLETSTAPGSRLRVSGDLLLWATGPGGAKDAPATLTDRFHVSDSELHFGPIVGGQGNWDRISLKGSTLWGDGRVAADGPGENGPGTKYATIGAGQAAGIMLSAPHVPWAGGKTLNPEAIAEIRYGRVGGTAAGAWWAAGIGRSETNVLGSDSFHIMRVTNAVEIIATWSAAGNMYIKRPSAYLEFGPNPSWGAYLRIGGNSTQNLADANIGQFAVSDGNIHLDTGNGKDFYVNFHRNNGNLRFGQSGRFIAVGNGDSYLGNIHDNNRRVFVKGEVNTVSVEPNVFYRDGTVNAHFASGVYNVVNAPQNPWGDNRWFFMLVISHISGTTWQRQIVWDMNGGTTASYSRKCNGADPTVAGNWTGWVHMGG